MLKKTLFLSNKCALTTKHEQLVIQSESRNATIPIEDIGFVVIEHQESYISIPALNKLIQNNVSTIFCDNKHMPQSMLLNLDGHHLQQTLFKSQIEAKEPLKKQLWQQIIKKKIANQAHLLNIMGKDTAVLKYFEANVLSGDTSNREAAAASFYWKNIFDFDFSRARNGVFPTCF